MLPVPYDPKLSSPGLLRAKAISSPTDVKVADRIVAELGIDAGIRSMRAAGPEQKRVAVGRRLRHRCGAEHAARASAILDDHRLPQLFAQPWRDDAGDHVDATAGDEWHDDLECLIGIILSSGRRSEADCEQRHRPCKNTPSGLKNSHPAYPTIEKAPKCRNRLRHQFPNAE